jgi:hypothetical protein
MVSCVHSRLEACKLFFKLLPGPWCPVLLQRLVVECLDVRVLASEERRCTQASVNVRCVSKSGFAEAHEVTEHVFRAEMRVVFV